MSAPSTELIIEAGRSDRNYYQDLWRYRELLALLAWRDVKVRYSQTLLGAAWALVQPLASVAIFTFVFGQLAKMPSGIEPYFITVMVGQLAWQLFANSLSNSSGSLLAGANLISKVYFPRLIVPAGAVVTSLVDFLITLGMLGILMIWHGFLPDWRLLTLPLFMLLTVAAALGAGLWLCALNVKYRDFRYVVPFIVQFGLYLSPVGFSSAKVPSYLRWLYDLNPMVGVIDGFRWACLRGTVPLDVRSLACSVTVTMILCFLGVWYFRRTEKTFADVI